jgi:phosphoglycolate phosphatase
MHGLTLVFDLDGTLVDTAPDLAAATNHVLKSRGLKPVNEKEILPFVGQGALKMIEQALAAHGQSLPQKELYDLFELFIVYYAAHIADHSRPYDGVIAALTRFQTEGATLAVCTNKLEAHARALLTALNMSRHFAAVTGRDSLVAYKPDARHLTGTIALASGDPKNSIMIGDSETDILTARNAGVPVIAFDFGYSIEPVASFAPDIVISHYNHLAGAIARVRTSR